MSRSDAVFYVNEGGYETVWSKPDCRFEVVRNGEMRIHAHLKGEEYPTIIRYTDQLLSYGITDDEALKRVPQDEALWDWGSNPWFEVWDKEDSSPESEVYDTLDEAIAFARNER